MTKMALALNFTTALNIMTPPSLTAHPVLAASRISAPSLFLGAQEDSPEDHTRIGPGTHGVIHTET